MSVSADVLYGLKMSLQFLYVTSVGLKSCVANYGTGSEMNLQYIRMCYYRTVCMYMLMYMLVLSSSFRWNNAVCECAVVVIFVSHVHFVTAHQYVQIYIAIYMAESEICVGRTC